MGGGLVQIAAYGSQDVYLTTNPTITFFKTVYNRYTNFSMESIIQLIDGTPNFSSSVSFIVARNGDLLANTTIQVSLPNPANYISQPTDYDYFGYIQGIGNYLIKYVSIEIGGSQIDEQYGKWLDIWSELSLNGSQTNGFGSMIGKNFNTPAWMPYDTSFEPGNKLIIPLQFWYCRNPGLSIPLIALQYHEIRIKLVFESFQNLIVGVKNGQYVLPELNGSAPSFANFEIWNNYCYLDTSERRKFAQNAHEYLIEQIQSQSGNVSTTTGINNIRLNLNNPTKELVWVFNRNGTNAPMCDFSIGNNIIPNGTPNQFAPLYNFKLLLNGTDRFKERPGEYFRLSQNYTHHTRIPGNYIYTYSFGLRPEEHQPSGTCNFSRIDTAQLNFVLRNDTPPGNGDSAPLENYYELPSYSLFAPSYNILRIMSGMGGLAYSN